MRTVTRLSTSALALLLAVGAAWAQNNQPGVKPAAQDAPKAGEPGVHRMEIYNGPIRTVHYVYNGLSASEAQAVKELERAENENILAGEMLNLRMQYVGGERVAEAQRRFSQQQLYGFSESQVQSTGYSAGWRNGRLGFISTGGRWPLGGWGWGSGGWGGYSDSMTAVSGGFTSSDSVGLAVGVGDEGRIKTEMARTIAEQASPEYAAKVAESLAVAANRAASFPTVAKGLDLKASSVLPVDAPLEFELNRGGVKTKVTGTLVKDEGDYLIIKGADGKTKAYHKRDNIDITLPEK